MLNKRKIASLLVGRHHAIFHKIGYASTFESYFKTVPCSGPVFPERYVERKSIHEFIASEVIKNEPVDYLEFGVFEGESIRWWSALNTHPDSRFIGFDTFSGLPEDWEEKSRGTFDVSGKVPDIDDCRVHFVHGLFQDTLREFLSGFTKKGRLIIHMDADLYSSTLFCLTSLDYLIETDSILIFDEFSSLAHEYAAFHDYCRSFNRDFRVICRTKGYEHIAFACL